MVKYNPAERINLYEALAHPFFDELRTEYLLLPNGNCLPDLFNFSEKEVKSMVNDDIRDIIQPKWYNPHTSVGTHEVTAEQWKSLNQIFETHKLK